MSKTAGLPTPVSEADLNRAAIDAVRINLRPLTTAMALVFVALAGVSSFLLDFGQLTVKLVALELSSAALVLGLRVVLGRRRIPDRGVYPVLLLIGLFVLARCFGQLYYMQSPRDTMSLALLIGAMGLISLSLAWSALLAAIVWTSWWIVAFPLLADSEWVHYGLLLFWATALGCAVQIARQRLVRRLAQAEARHQLLVEHLPVISYLDDVRPGGGPLYVSPQVEKILGYTSAEWVGTHDFWKGLLYTPDKEPTLAAMRAHIAARTGWELEYRIRARDGRVIWIHDRSTLIASADGGHPLSYGIMVDVTGRKKAEALSAGANRVLAQIATGAPLEDVLQVLVNACEEVEPGTTGVALLLGEDNRLRHAAVRRLPEFFLAATDSAPLGIEANPFAAAAYERRSVVIEDIAACAEWSEHRAAALHAGFRAVVAEPILSSSGKVLGTLATYYNRQIAGWRRDTMAFQAAASLAAVAIERVRAEGNLERHREHLEQLVAERTQQLEASVGQLRHAERLASVGTLAAGIAHEINNPVGMILLSAEQALVKVSAANAHDPLVSFLQEIAANARRCGRIVRNVLRFARQEPAERWPNEVNVIVQQAIDLTHTYVTGRGGTILTRLAAHLPPVLLNPVELEQVFVNLLCNAVESADTAPALIISSERIDSVVRVSVRDNGRGIPADAHGRIFDPFYTTRQAEGGTGLGLSLAYGIVTDHGGTIRVDCPPEGGTTMIIELPIRASDTAIDDGSMGLRGPHPVTSSRGMNPPEVLQESRPARPGENATTRGE